MKESISYTYLLNMMLVFIFVSFSVVMVTISYTKAYRINSKIADVIEDAEGYNEKSVNEINRLISAFGYQQPNITCKERSTGVVVETDIKGICIYEIDSGDYYSYGITTYMLFDLPLLNMLRIPVYNTTEKIYKFN